MTRTSSRRDRLVFSLALSLALASAGLGGASAGCGNLIGIGPVTDDAGVGTAGSGSGSKEQNQTASGSGGNGGRANTGGAGAGQHSAGAPVATGGAGGEHESAGGAGAAGHGNTGGAGSGSTAGASAGVAGLTGGTGSAAGSSVHGKIIDTWARPIADATVQIGAQTATTDAQGVFDITAVPATYDLGIVINTPGYTGSPVHNVWIYEGLQRRDPTLEVYPVPDRHFATLSVHGTGSTSPLPKGQTLYAAFGSNQVDFADSSDNPEFRVTSSTWSGPTAIQGTTHGLLVRGTSDSSAVPAEFLSHDSKPTALQADTTTDINLSLTDKPSAGTISGQVQGSHGGVRSNWAALRWTDGAVINLPGDSGADTFSLTLPSLPNAAITVAAREGEDYRPPFAISYAENVALAAAVNLTLPATPTPIAPAEDATGADPSTQFEWSGAGPVFLLSIATGIVEEQMYIVTTNKTAHLPSRDLVPYALPPNQEFYWRVETHGNVKTVDEATGPNGYLSAYWDKRLHGSKRGNGSLAVSAVRRITTAAN